jgi:hypothetical protein
MLERVKLVASSLMSALEVNPDQALTDYELQCIGVSMEQFEKAMADAESCAVVKANQKVRQLKNEHTALTLQWVKATEQMQQVMKEEITRLEGQIQTWEPRTVPLSKRLAELEARERQSSAERDKLLREWPTLENREKGEALRRLFETVTLFWDKTWHSALAKPTRPRKTERKGRWEYTLRRESGDLIRRRMGTGATHRRMDNVPISLDTPAEDEFALCLTGTPSPYLDMAFPNRPQIYRKYLDMVGVSPRDRAAWKRSWRRFLQRLTYRRPGRLLLKSPTHTARIKLLLEVFPDARFVHIVRNPYVVFSSTHKMILAMTTELSLQEPPFPALDEEIFTGYLQLMGRLEEDRGLIAPARFYQVRYEDLTADPLNQVRAIYDHLDLGGFEQQRPRLERYLARLGSYQTNRYELAPELRAEITKRWGHFIRKYGYAEEE